jgi:hypothetical protein
MAKSVLKKPTGKAALAARRKDNVPKRTPAPKVKLARKKKAADPTAEPPASAAEQAAQAKLLGRAMLIDWRGGKPVSQIAVDTGIDVDLCRAAICAAYVAKPKRTKQAHA